jgi:hypothetical protein
VGPVALVGVLVRRVFFGLQFAIQAPTRDGWSRRYADCVRLHQRGLGAGDQRALLARIAGLLRQALPRVTLAYWDYVVDGTREFDEWVRGVEDDVQEKWQPDRSGAPLDHALATVVLLVAESSADGQALAYGCDLPESVWRQRATYARLIDLLGQLSCAHFAADAVYLTPGTDLAFSRRELEGEGYEYLLPVE